MQSFMRISSKYVHVIGYDLFDIPPNVHFGLQLKSENAKLRELLTVSQADADRTKSELLKLQTQITSIGSSLNCSGIRVQGCVKLDQKWENILKNALRHQYQLKDARDHEEGVSDKEMEEAEKMLREFFPGDPEEVVWEFPDLYQMFLRIQGFLRAGNAAVDFWQAKASKPQPNSDSNSGPSEVSICIMSNILRSCFSPTSRRVQS